MHSKHFQFVLGFCFFLFWMDGAAQNEKYWVKFTDKANTHYSVDKPEEFLSTRSIERRQKQGIAIDSTDFPVNKVYLDSITQTGAKVLCTSKWLNAATIETSDASVVELISAFSFVDTLMLSWVAPILKSANLKLESPHKSIDDETPIEYGFSYTQIAMHQGDLMHENGFTGNGQLIAILDAGFMNADTVSSLKHLFDEGRILGAHDFVDPQNNVYNEHAHGMEVLSTMGAYEPGILVGTAFDASFFLIRTEDVNSEQPVELDYWVAGAEFADSIGADLINSSLGYYAWDLPFTDNTYEDMDGKTLRASIGASFAAKKGIIITSSAGNEGNDTYGKLVSPSDAPGVVCVGSVDKDSTYTSFSSRGFSSDERVKPNLVANGRNAVVQLPDGKFSYVNGTSFSSPITCGLLAILWQALPGFSATEIIDLAQKNAHLYENPDMYYGYGIPNIYEAYTKVTGVTDSLLGQFLVYPNPFKNSIKIILPENENANENISLAVYSISGQIIMLENNIAYQAMFNLDTSTLPQGMYILKLNFSNSSYSQLISKQ